MAKKDGGSAKNLTVRDALAMVALQGLTANQEITKELSRKKLFDAQYNRAWFAETAYLLSDAMLAEREKP